ncbi:hypothetical protein F53441_5591 [Fusarium austroafricanum]|uniref:F-box domain-containing protein n=1 Tax=Fusarium austroafricanum TaxID=2364996 RepID=A0A8H4KLJ1_9HYPO|nr:hypothetical protein F53441_5591 [Fusarium austroafricanum]
MSKTPTGYFELLPNELLLHLVCLLPITDVLSLKCATHNLLLVLELRIRPSQYIQSIGPFNNSHELLETMARHGAVISGSRALEYFVPGSATSESDWDFYVPPILASVVAVKHALERSGVTFESSLSRAARQLIEKSSTTLSRDQIVAVANEAFFNTRNWSEEEKTIIAAIHNTYPELRDMAPYIREDGSIRWIDAIVPVTIQDVDSVTLAFPEPHQARSNNYPDGIAAKVLNGTAFKSGKMVFVQLIIGNIDPRRISVIDPLVQTIFRSIFSFYGSHVQCMLTKHVALHMYYRLTLDKIAYRWNVPEALQPKAEAAVQKYISRGYNFQEAEEDAQWVSRSSQDEDSCLIEFDTNCCYGYLPSVSQVKGLQWRHTGQLIRPSLQSAMVDARHELLCHGIRSMRCI